MVLATLCAPALSALISNNYLIAFLTSNGLPEQALALISAATPELASTLSATMTMAQAEQLIANLPPELLPLLKEKVLPATDLQLALLSAHMIIFWLSQDSNVTPPVCLTAFTAAAIAGTRPMATGVTAWKLAKGLYVVPLLFAYTPLLSDSLSESLPVFLFSLVGLYVLVAALQGHWLNPLNLWQRFLFLLLAIGLMIPLTSWSQISVLIAGTALLAGIQRYGHRPINQQDTTTEKGISSENSV